MKKGGKNACRFDLVRLGWEEGEGVKERGKKGGREGGREGGMEVWENEGRGGQKRMKVKIKDGDACSQVCFQ